MRLTLVSDATHGYLYTFSPAAKEDVCSIWAKLMWAGWELAYRPRVRLEEEIQAMVE